MIYFRYHPLRRRIDAPACLIFSVSTLFILFLNSGKIAKIIIFRAALNYFFWHVEFPPDYGKFSNMPILTLPLQFLDFVTSKNALE